MTKDNYLHCTLVCDRSGSMSIIKTDAEGAVNNFVDSQRNGPGECTLTLVDFDAPGSEMFARSSGKGESWFRVVHQGPIADTPKYRLEPRGNTALLDAVGQAITQTGEWLAAKPEDERPNKVVFVVQTDGQENSSREWSWSKVREAVNRQHDEFGWEFVFLGVGVDTWDQAAMMGAQHSTRTGPGGQHVNSAYANLGQTMSAVRGGTADSFVATNVDITDDDATVEQRP